MHGLTSGTLAGTGSFRCEQCGYVVTLSAEDKLPACPACGGDAFARASLFATGTFPRPVVEEEPEHDTDIIAAAHDQAPASGEFLAFRDGSELQLVELSREWTRIGRSLAADVRFDDPTVSRRHALIVRQHDGVRVLDDRSLNGVFVNGERVEWQVLRDGDEIIVGRYHLYFIEAGGEREGAAAGGATASAG